MTHIPTIGLVDDEPEMLRALRRLLLGEGFHVRTFGSAEDFLQQFTTASLDCVVLDVSMPGLGGLDVQERLNQAGAVLPVIFLTGRGDIPTSVRAIKAGAVNFLTKPVERAELLAALRVALTEGALRRAKEAELAEERARLALLTPRELEVLRHVIKGQLNKQIAADLGTSEQTIKVHRMHITEKMGIASVAELVHATARLGVLPAGQDADA
jgi:FixJ family two-component response regulator|uniref:response regulator transcription factor n=1 Tax=Prosthecobacter sp. TaxID=1965333 RepID=UPI00378351CC